MTQDSTKNLCHLAHAASLPLRTMPVPTDRTYLETHEWHKLDGDTVTIGITQIAADELTDITSSRCRKSATRSPPTARSARSNRSKPPATCTAASPARSRRSTSELANNPGLVNTDPLRRRLDDQGQGDRSAPKSEKLLIGR